MTRISLVEQYDNKDVIQQIYRLKNLVETGTVSDIQVDQSGGDITVTLTMNDGTTEVFNLTTDYITSVTSSQSGTTVTLNFIYASGNTDTITFNGSAGDATATPSTLALRDANARLTAADPASGATDGTLGTTNWISQTGNTAPNNLLHRSGNESFAGVKTAEDHFVSEVNMYNVPSIVPRVSGSGWVKIYESDFVNHLQGIVATMPRRAQSNPGFGILAIGGHNSGTVMCKWMSSTLVPAGAINNFMVTVESDKITFWGKPISGTDNTVCQLIGAAFNGAINTTDEGWKAAADNTVYTMTDDGLGNYTGYVDSGGVIHTFISYMISS